MALTKITSRILDSSGVTTLGTISTGVWQGTAINQTYLVGQSGTNTGDETLARINALDITELGTVSSGVWNGTAIASAYLDADTAHLSTTQTFTGAKTFSSTVTTGGAIDNPFKITANPGTRSLKLTSNSTNYGTFISWLRASESYEKAYLGFTSTSDDVFEVNNRENADMTFHTNTNERVRILATGNVGIGTTSPFNNVQIKQTGDSGNNYVEGTLQVGGGSAVLGAALSYSALGSGRLNLSSLNNSGGANALISLGFGAITSGAPANTVMTLNQTGDVTLNGNGTTSALLFGQSSYARIINTSGQTLYVDSDVHEFRTNAGGAKLTISSAGVVGINNGQSRAKINIGNNSSGAVTRGIILENRVANAQGTGSSIEFYVNNGDNDRCAIIQSVQETAGNYANLEFFTANNGAPTKRLTISSGGNATLVGTLNIGNGSASTPGLNFAGNGDAGFYNVGGDNIGFAANGAAVYSMNTDGITLESGKGLFVGGTGSANKLDDYEEGTWTPVWQGTSVTMNIQSGYYTKIGNLVRLSVSINVTSGGSSNQSVITGLPFACKTGANLINAVDFYNVSTNFTGSNIPLGTIASGASQILCYRTTTTSNAVAAVWVVGAAGSIELSVTYLSA